MATVADTDLVAAAEAAAESLDQFLEAELRDVTTPQLALERLTAMLVYAAHQCVSTLEELAEHPNGEALGILLAHPDLADDWDAGLDVEGGLDLRNNLRAAQRFDAPALAAALAAAVVRHAGELPWEPRLDAAQQHLGPASPNMRALIALQVLRGRRLI